MNKTNTQKTASKEPVFLDTETTGFYAQNGDELLEIAIVTLSGKVMLNTLIKPVHKMTWPDAMAINKITPEMVAHAPLLTDVAGEIINALSGREVRIWNAKFDAAFMPWALEKSTVVCEMTEFGNYIERTQPENKSESGRYKMQRVAEELGVETEGQEHRALSDILTMIHIHQTYTAPEFNRTDLCANKHTPGYV